MKRSRLRVDPEKVRAWQQRSRRRLRQTVSRRARPDDPLATWCEAMVAGGVCTGRAQHRHHKAGRGAAWRDERTVDLCHACHTYVHAHPDWSYAAGWLEHR